MRQTITLMIALTALLLPAAALAARERVEVLQNQLEHPWALAFLPDDRGILMTLRGGELRLWQREKGLAPAISGVPQVWANGQGGLLDVALAPDFAQSRRVWLSYAEGGSDDKAGTAVGYGRLSEDLQRLENFQVVFRQQPSSQPATILAGGWCSTAAVICLSVSGRITSVRPLMISISCREKWCG